MNSVLVPSQSDVSGFFKIIRDLHYKNISCLICISYENPRPLKMKRDKYNNKSYKM